MKLKLPGSWSHRGWHRLWLAESFPILKMAWKNCGQIYRLGSLGFLRFFLKIFSSHQKNLGGLNMESSNLTSCAHIFFSTDHSKGKEICLPFLEFFVKTFATWFVWKKCMFSLPKTNMTMEQQKQTMNESMYLLLKMVKISSNLVMTTVDPTDHGLLRSLQQLQRCPRLICFPLKESWWMNGWRWCFLFFFKALCGILAFQIMVFQGCYELMKIWGLGLCCRALSQEVWGVTPMMMSKQLQTPLGLRGTTFFQTKFRDCT